MWIAYIFNMEFSKQKGLIRILKPIIEEFEENGLIKSFNYNHYYSKEPKEVDHLAVRLEFSISEKKKLFDDRLNSLNLSWEEQDYAEKAEVKKAYELGSRWAFLFFNLVEKEKLSEKLLKNEDFQLHMVHGLFNSLGIPSIPDERDLHYSLYLHFSEKLNVDLKPYIEELNKGEPSLIYQRMIELSKKLCSEKLDKGFTRANAEGKVLPFPLENLIWASALVTAAWLGWIFKSKAIWHYGKPHQKEEIILRNHLIPSIIAAFEQGIIKAIDDKKEITNQKKQPPHT